MFNLVSSEPESKNSPEEDQLYVPRKRKKIVNSPLSLDTHNGLFTLKYLHNLYDLLNFSLMLIVI